MKGRNKCCTYFRITGDFDPKEISEMLGLLPESQWRVGDARKNGGKYEFSSWTFGYCRDYDVYVENQMLRTIQPLLLKIELLKSIKKKYRVSYTLEIVPSLYADETTPCLAPSKEVMKFCLETDTDMDIDLYLFDSGDE